jgi:hypothetical protein
MRGSVTLGSGAVRYYDGFTNDARLVLDDDDVRVNMAVSSRVRGASDQTMSMSSTFSPYSLCASESGATEGAA